MTHIFRTLTAVALFVMLSFNAFSQNVGINADGSEPDSRTILDVKSTNKGVLLPRLSDTERDALYQNVPNGMLIFNTTTQTLQIFSNNGWYPLSMGAGIDAPLPPTDGDGNTYTSVVIGTQEWLVENLKTTKYNDGITDIATSWGTTPSYAWYGNDSNNKNVYGALYNWYAVDATSTSGKNICPVGWHVPTDAEWTTLNTYLGGESVAGGKMKETGTTHWESPNTDATNSSGFTALPSGYRSNDGEFESLGYFGYYWSSTQYDDSDAWNRYLGFADADCYRGLSLKQNGNAVRCVKD